MAWLHDLAEYINNISPAADGLHNNIASWFYWWGPDHSASTSLCCNFVAHRTARQHFVRYLLLLWVPVHALLLNTWLFLEEPVDTLHCSRHASNLGCYF